MSRRDARGRGSCEARGFHSLHREMLSRRTGLVLVRLSVPSGHPRLPGEGRPEALDPGLQDALATPPSSLRSSRALCDQPCRERCQRTVLGRRSHRRCATSRPPACATPRAASPTRTSSRPRSSAWPWSAPESSGLACALNLAQKRYQVTVFDKEAGWGGSLRSHPRFAEFDADIALQFSAVEVEFRFGTGGRIAR